MFHAKQIASSVDAFALTNDANSVRATERAYPVEAAQLASRHAIAALLCEVLSKLGISHETLARRWTVSRPRATAILSGRDVLSLEKADQLPEKARKEFLKRLNERWDGDGTDGDHGTLGREALACSVANGALSAAAAVDDKPAAYMAATELEKAAKRAKAAAKGAKK